MLKTNILFALIGLNRILSKQCKLDEKKHNQNVTDFGKSKYNLCNYISIVRPRLLYYLKLVSGKDLLDDIKHGVNNKKMNYNAHLIKPNQIYMLLDIKANAPLTHASVYEATAKAIKQFDFSFDTSSISTKAWSWM